MPAKFFRYIKPLSSQIYVNLSTVKVRKVALPVKELENEADNSRESCSDYLRGYLRIVQVSIPSANSSTS